VWLTISAVIFIMFFSLAISFLYRWLYGAQRTFRFRGTPAIGGAMQEFFWVGQTVGLGNKQK